MSGDTRYSIVFGIGDLTLGGWHAWLGWLAPWDLRSIVDASMLGCSSMGDCIT